jgi:hypothetical protein
VVLQLRVNSPDWIRDGALCVQPRDADIEDFDIPFEEPELQMDVCNGVDGTRVCPMRAECLMFALVNNEQFGIWGGMTPEDRKYMRRRIRRDQWQWRSAEWLEARRELEELSPKVG